MLNINQTLPLKRKCRHFDEILSLATPEVVILTTSGVTNDEIFVKMTVLLQYCQRC